MIVGDSYFSMQYKLILATSVKLLLNFHVYISILWPLKPFLHDWEGIEQQGYFIHYLQHLESIPLWIMTP